MTRTKTYRVTWTDGTVIDVTATNAAEAQIKATEHDKDNPDFRGPTRRPTAVVRSVAVRRDDAETMPAVLVNLFRF
jgi:hypothetical protein